MQKRDIDRIVDAISPELYVEVFLPPDAAASDTWERPIFKARDDVTLSEIVVVPITGIGQATNYMTLSSQNKGAAGSGTTEIATLAVNSTNTIGAMIGRDLLTTNADVDKDIVVTLKKAVTASGQSFPGGLVRVKFKKR